MTSRGMMTGRKRMTGRESMAGRERMTYRKARTGREMRIELYFLKIVFKRGKSELIYSMHWHDN